jgi:hypothetical protein
MIREAVLEISPRLNEIVMPSVIWAQTNRIFKSHWLKITNAWNVSKIEPWDIYGSKCPSDLIMIEWDTTSPWYEHKPTALSRAIDWKSPFHFTNSFKRVKSLTLKEIRYGLWYEPKPTEFQQFQEPLIENNHVFSPTASNMSKVQSCEIWFAMP